MLAICVSVGYSEQLRCNLPLFAAESDLVVVVTDYDDAATADVVVGFPNVVLHKTNVFYAGGARFNKGGAMQEAIERYCIDYHGWVCLFDADITPPAGWAGHDMQVGNLYNAWRHQDGKRINDGVYEMPGYFVLYHTDDPRCPKSPTLTSWDHAGNYDSVFKDHWPRRNRVKLPFIVQHSGPTGENWFGIGNRHLIHEMREERRRRGGYAHEAIGDATSVVDAGATEAAEAAGAVETVAPMQSVTPMQLVMPMPEESDTERNALAAVCLAWWRTQFPEWQVMQAPCQIGPNGYWKSRVVNQAMAQLTTEYVGMIDCDVIPYSREQVLDAVGMLTRYEFTAPHSVVNRLDAEQTQRYINCNELAIGHQHPAMMSGGVFFARRSAWIATRGFPEVLSGWGGEDDAMRHIMRMVGRIHRHPGTLLHLYHTPQDSKANIIGRRNLDLARRAVSARRDEMRKAGGGR